MARNSEAYRTQAIVAAVIEIRLVAENFVVAEAVAAAEVVIDSFVLVVIVPVKD